MVLARIVNEGIRLGSRYFKQLHRYDVAIHKGLYGASAGRGVRHGRDAGIFISQYITGGDDLDGETGESPSIPSNKFPQARGRYRKRSAGSIPNRKYHCDVCAGRKRSNKFNY